MNKSKEKIVHQLVNVHGGDLGVVRGFLLGVGGGGRPLPGHLRLGLAVDRPVGRGVLLGELHLGLGFGHHWVTGRIQLLEGGIRILTVSISV